MRFYLIYALFHTAGNEYNPLKLFLTLFFLEKVNWEQRKKVRDFGV
jgi:hypothetical protein